MAIAFLAIMATIVVSSLRPMSELYKNTHANILSFDHEFHFAAYFALAFSGLLAFARRDIGIAGRFNAWTAFILFGAAMEILQATLPGINRTCTMSDLTANAAGAAIAVILIPRVWLAAGRTDASAASEIQGYSKTA